MTTNLKSTPNSARMKKLFGKIAGMVQRHQSQHRPSSRSVRGINLGVGHACESETRSNGGHEAAIAGRAGDLPRYQRC